MAVLPQGQAEVAQLFMVIFGFFHGAQDALVDKGGPGGVFDAVQDGGKVQGGGVALFQLFTGDAQLVQELVELDYAVGLGALVDAVKEGDAGV